MKILKVILAAIVVAHIAISEGADDPKLVQGQGFLWIDRNGGTKFLQHIVNAKSRLSMISRSETGDRLFVQFGDNGNQRVAIVSSNGVTVKDLPGPSILNRDGDPVFWLRDRTDNFEFVSGFLLPTKTYPLDFISDGRYMALANTNHYWIARVESPMEMIRTVDSRNVQLFSDTNRLYVFVPGQPEGQRRKDGSKVLKRYEYRIDGKEFNLIRIQDFDFTWHVFDLDPKNDLMVVRSQSDMFPSAWLVQARTGARKRMGFVAGDDGLFLNNDVIRTYNLRLKRRP